MGISITKYNEEIRTSIFNCNTIRYKDCQNLFKSVYPYMIKTPKIIYEIIAAQKFKKSKILSSQINKDILRIILKKCINNYIDFTYDLIVKLFKLYNDNKFIRQDGLRSFLKFYVANLANTYINLQDFYKRTYIY